MFYLVDMCCINSQLGSVRIVLTYTLGLLKYSFIYKQLIYHSVSSYIYFTSQ